MIQAEASPIRTCIGCRATGSISELFRVVVRVENAPPSALGLQLSILMVDERRNQPGRGAWLHPSTKCLELSLKKRAFSRAFKIQGEIDASDVEAFVERALLTEVQI